jgi:aminoglycoside phosphotransferase (APT) family kinase protein
MAEQAPRSGEALDGERVSAWLRTQVSDLDGTPIVTQFVGGASNWTYRLKYANRDLVLRRAPTGTKSKGAHDMAREFRLQQALKPAYPLVPTMIALCEDDGVLGAPFYLMERVDGVILRKEMPSHWRLTPMEATALCERFLDALVALHQVDVQANGLSHLGKGAGYAERQISGWTARYQKARTWNVPRAADVMRWLERNVPARETICVVHNDFRFDNLVFPHQGPSQIVAVLDWELAALGDPLMDVFAALAYWIQADDDWFGRQTRRQPTNAPGMLARQQLVARYLQKRGETFADIDPFVVLLSK